MSGSLGTCDVVLKYNLEKNSSTEDTQTEHDEWGTNSKIMLYSNLNVIVNFSVSPHLIMVYVAAF